MNRTFRTVSALMRHAWLIEESFAKAHEPLINSYLSGQLIDVSEEDRGPIGYFVSGQTRISRSGRSRVAPLGTTSQISGPWKLLAADTTSALIRHEIAADTLLPDNSIFVLDIRGVIMKEGSCFSYGTEEYVELINAAYANPSIIGIVVLVDSPGGQLSGTPTLYDAIRNPIKPTISVVNEGLMASAAYWLACGSNYIYATQKSDQIGSIGVYVQLLDSSKAMKAAGYEVHQIYSDRSSEKNKPVKDALKGNYTAMIADLNEAADQFADAVRAGRGKRLKAAKDVDVFKGGLFYASKAIELGLIDGFGDLDTAVEKIYQLSGLSPTPLQDDPLQEEEQEDDLEEDGLEESDESSDENPQEPQKQVANSLTKPLTPTSASAPSTPGEPITPEPAGSADLQSDSQPQNNEDMSLFGDKHKKLSALAGREAASITDAELNDINADLDTQNITGARVISTAYMNEAVASIAELATANTAIANLTKERDDALAAAEAFGDQPGHLGTKSPKVDEKTAGADQQNKNPFYSTADAERAALQAQIAK